ncbi:MAG: DUF4192 family protein [Micromonosporaceae bacterium]|nr:DUF4192 family protein [Micromonosporaceae bacterium]
MTSPSDRPTPRGNSPAGLRATHPLPEWRAVAARLAPVTGAARDRMVNATAAAAQFLLELVTIATEDASPDPNAPLEPSLDTPLGRALLAAARTYLTQVRHRYRTGAVANDEEAALVTILLELSQVREFAARGTTAASWEIDMWIDLVRRAEPDFTAGPAVMLALAAMQAGDSPLAASAVWRALRADPTDRLASVLATAIAAGIDPGTVTALLSG